MRRTDSPTRCTLFWGHGDPSWRSVAGFLFGGVYMTRMGFVAIVTLMISTSLAYAQDEQKEVATAKNSLQAGAWALQFRISGDFRLSSFQGTVLSLKHHRSSKSAFRLGLGFDFYVSEESRVSTQTDTIIAGSEEKFDQNRQSIQLEFQYLRYPNPGPRLSYFVGVGPLIGFNRRYDQTSSVLAEETTTWLVGASGQFGVEWFATRSISFHAEYGAQITYLWLNREEVWSDHVRNVDANRWDISARSLLFGLSAYF